MKIFSSDIEQTLTKNVKCPLCRTQNHISIDQKKVSGIDVKCSICMDHNVQIFLPDCGHICLCEECFNKLCT